MKEVRTKRQHYVPRFYLSHFAAAEGIIWTYDCQRDEVRPNSPENTAVETNFYSVKSDDGTYDDRLEKWLSEVESKAAPLYEALVAGKIPVDQEKADLAVFLASLHTRSPALITAAAELKGAMTQRLMDFIARDPVKFDLSIDQWARATGQVIDKEQREKLRAFIQDKERYSMDVLRQAGLSAMGATDKIAEIFFGMRWILVRCKEQHLITSDNPVVRLTPPEAYHPIYGDGGFLNKKAYVTVPLNANMLLEMGWAKELPEGLYAANKERGRLYNRQRARFAERYLFASRRDAGIQALAKKYAEPGVRIAMEPSAKLAPIKVKRRLGD